MLMSPQEESIDRISLDSFLIFSETLTWINLMLNKAGSGYLDGLMPITSARPFDPAARIA